MSTKSKQTIDITLEACQEQVQQEAGKKMILFLPNCLNDLIEDVKQKHQDAYQIRRGTWVEGYGKLNKPDIIYQMMIEGLKAIEERIGSIETDPNALHNK